MAEIATRKKKGHICSFFWVSPPIEYGSYRRGVLRTAYRQMNNMMSDTHSVTSCDQFNLEPDNTAGNGSPKIQ
jgi:hypothetical protein